MYRATLCTTHNISASDDAVCSILFASFIALDFLRKPRVRLLFVPNKKRTSLRRSYIVGSTDQLYICASTCSSGFAYITLRILKACFTSAIFCSFYFVKMLLFFQKVLAESWHNLYFTWLFY